MKTPRSPEATAIRYRMDALGLQTVDLAELAGYRPGYVSNVIGGFERSSRARQKIEEVLKIAIWPKRES